MKTKLLLIVLAMVVSSGLFAQDVATDVVTKTTPYIDVTLGYAPKSEYNALKPSLSVNNILLKRIGFYTSFEIGMNSDYFSNIIGITGTIAKPVYLFAGVDWFTKNNGVFGDKDVLHVRKEFGVGILPYKGLVVRLGWSLEVGITFAAGYKFSLK
jgi:hypothetical protein